MSPEKNEASSLASKKRVEEGLEALCIGLRPYVAKHMQDRHGSHWRHYASRARGDESGGELDAYALLKTLLDQWSDLFRHDAKLRKAWSFISLAIDARNSAAHFKGDLGPRQALRYLDAMRELLAAVGAEPQVTIVEGLYETERAASGGGPAPEPVPLTLDEPPPPERLHPWREVCEPHPDVLEARFSDAEFATNLALVVQGEGGEEYGDPAAFFRITYVTEGLRRVLGATLARLAGRGGEPVIGLHTNFGGGKTHKRRDLPRSRSPTDVRARRPEFRPSMSATSDPTDLGSSYCAQGTPPEVSERPVSLHQRWIHMQIDLRLLTHRLTSCYVGIV